MDQTLLTRDNLKKVFIFISFPIIIVFDFIILLFVVNGCLQPNCIADYFDKKSLTMQVFKRFFSKK